MTLSSLDYHIFRPGKNLTTKILFPVPNFLNSNKVYCMLFASLKVLISSFSGVIIIKEKNNVFLTSSLNTNVFQSMRFFWW